MGRSHGFTMYPVKGELYIFHNIALVNPVIRILGFIPVRREAERLMNSFYRIICPFYEEYRVKVAKGKQKDQ